MRSLFLWFTVLLGLTAALQVRSPNGSKAAFGGKSGGSNVRMQPQQQQFDQSGSQEEEYDDEEEEGEDNNVPQDCLYERLGVGKQAPAEQIKKAYKKLSLKYHPDKCKEPDAADKFIKISEAYQVLSDEKKRSRYDVTGRIDECATAGMEFEEQVNYWKSLYTAVTPEAIISFLDKYRGSEEEENDVLKYVLDYNGDVSVLMRHMYDSQPSDVKRWEAIIKKLISKNKINEAIQKQIKANWHRLVAKADKQRKADQREREEFEQLKKQGEIPSFDLGQIIALRQNARAENLDYLAAKYARDDEAEVVWSDEDAEEHEEELLEDDSKSNIEMAEENDESSEEEKPVKKKGKGGQRATGGKRGGKRHQTIDVSMKSKEEESDDVPVQKPNRPKRTRPSNRQRSQEEEGEPIIQPNKGRKRVKK